jgi:1-aminocyclopropane-1-carboxylate deaminase
LLAYTPTPVQELHDPLFEQSGVRVLIKREDINHPYASGNKWWKLKYNLEEALLQKQKTLLTFGGAYSNHIYATAAAAKELGFQSIGIIRGEETLPLNATLRFAAECGMKLHYVTRDLYRHKHEEQFVKELHNQFGDFYRVPEGGTNELAVRGVEEFAQSLGDDFDYLCCAVGTGGTLAGLINGLPDRIQILGFPVLKSVDYLADEIRKYVYPDKKNWRLVTGYHFGGYAKTTNELLSFIKQVEQLHALPLDFVYTAKVVYGVYQMIRNGDFRMNSKILILHTGGLQGRGA